MSGIQILKKITAMVICSGMFACSSLSVYAEDIKTENGESINVQESKEQDSDTQDNEISDGDENEKTEEPSENEDITDEEPPEEEPEEFKYEYGVDISKWQGRINFDLLANDQDVRFAILRAGNYGYGIDSRFEEYYNGLSARGVKLGAYLFCSETTLNGFIDAAYTFLRYLEGKKWDMPVYFDLEEYRQYYVGKNNLTYYTLTALNILRENGYTAGVYGSKAFLNDALHINLISAAGYEIWMAHYTDQRYVWSDPMSRYGMCDIWQYTDEGRIPAITENYVDMNVAYKKYPEKKEKYVPRKWITGGEPSLRFRSGPGTVFTQIDSIKPHMVITVNDVMEADGYKWGLVRYNGMPGWCALDYSKEISEDQEYILKYDTDGDGFIDKNDAQRICSKILMSENTDVNCDVNGDGEVDVLDYMRLKTVFLG